MVYNQAFLQDMQTDGQLVELKDMKMAKERAVQLDNMLV